MYLDINEGQGRLGGVFGLSFSREDALLAAGGANNVIIWNIYDGRIVSIIPADGIRSLKFLRSMVLATADIGVTLWDARSGQRLATIKGNSESIDVAPDGNTLAMRTSDPAVQLYNVFGVGLTDKIEIYKRGVVEWNTGPCHYIGRLGSISAPVFIREGKEVAADDHDGTLRVFDASDLNQVHEVQITYPTISSYIAASPSAQYLANAIGKIIRVWECHGFRLILEIETRGLHRALSISPCGHIIAAGGYDGKVCLWKLPSGEKVVEFSDHSSPVTALEFSHDGSLLASGDREGTIVVRRMKGICITHE